MRQPIPVQDFKINIHPLWDKEWFVLTSGDYAAARFNLMTVSWGAMGNMWDKPFALVVVRNTRYTFEFMNRYDTFTLTAFPGEWRDALLNVIGTKSGRDCDKVAETGLTPIPSTRVAAPGYAQADLIIECRKIYQQDYDPGHFIDPSINDHYKLKDYHRVYFGEILAILGEQRYKG